MDKKCNYKSKKALQGIFSIATLWLIGRTAQKYLLWTSTGAFATAGTWKEYFTYTIFDKMIFFIQLIALLIIIINITSNRKNVQKP